MSNYSEKLLLLTLILWTGMAAAAERVGDFSLLDQQGYFHQMSWYDNYAAVVLLVKSGGSEAFRSDLDAVVTLQQKYEGMGVKFFVINSMVRHDRKAVAAELAQLGVDTIPVLMDDTQYVSEALGIEQAGEVLVYDPAAFTVEFRGPAGAELEQALNAMIGGHDVPVARVAVSGEAVSYPAREAHRQQVPSYAEEIAPIIAENCASCHREGGIAPFALNSHAMVQGWSPMIREVLMTKRMPPGQIDGHVGDFVNDMLVADGDQQKLLHWIDAGAPHGGATDPLANLNWPASKWAFGEPDYIIKVPPQSIPATGVLDYIHVVVPIETDQDYWVQGSQYVAGDRTVLHHTLNNLLPPGAGIRRGGFLGGGDHDAANITAYIPGAEPVWMPENTGGLLKKGSKLALQLHYTTNGRETVDASEIGLWFYPPGEVPQKRLSSDCACIFTPTWTNIPPNDPEFIQQASVTLPRSAYLRSFTPHMHFRGKYMRFYAEYPDGNREQLINIANYDYNWQLAYTYAKPRLMPAGTRLIAVGAFDNSAQNPDNPDPSRSVPWGQQSWDEMFFGAMQWVYADDGGE